MLPPTRFFQERQMITRYYHDNILTNVVGLPLSHLLKTLSSLGALAPREAD